MNILITGANGFIGRHLAYALQNNGHHVVVCIHKKNHITNFNSNFRIIICDYNRDNTLKKWLNRLANIDVVINSVGIFKETVTQKFEQLHHKTPITLFKASDIIGVRKIINISALGADESAFSKFHLSKKAADDFLKKLKLNWIVIKPSIVYGPGARSMDLFKMMAALPITPLLDSGNQKIQAIHIDDFCKAVNYLVTNEELKHLEIAFVGAEAITMKNSFIVLKQWLNMESHRFVKIRYSVMLLLSKFSEKVNHIPITVESIKMLRHGNTADVTPFIYYFGFKPLDFASSLNKFPAQQADQWHAKLFVLKPFLKISIAFIWIFTGITSAFIYPVESSYSLLEQLGIKGYLAPITLYSAATLDFFSGIAILLSYKLKLIGILQITIIVSYTLIISLFLSEQWSHPFGAISKNIPLIVATMIMLVLHDKKWR